MPPGPARKASAPPPEPAPRGGVPAPTPPPDPRALPQAVAASSPAAPREPHPAANRAATGHSRRIATATPAAVTDGHSQTPRTAPPVPETALPTTSHPKRCDAWSTPAHDHRPPAARASPGTTGPQLARTPTA